jgi:hypothetical protein
MSVLSFDIGIKNLAWCVTNLSGQTLQICGWGNYNLLEDRSTEGGPKAAVVTCASCAAKAKFTSSAGHSCARHVPAAQPILKDLSGVALTKIPGAPVLKKILAAKGVKPIPKDKAAMVTAVKQFASLPIEKVKVPHAAAINISEIHDSLRKFVTEQLVPFFPDLREVRLENQPVLKNPVMKTIQILLFATLRDAMVNAGHQATFKLVHAGMKVKGAAAGDAGYADRKKGSEDRTIARLKAANMTEGQRWLEFFQGHKKRSDLADAFCMCLDATPPPPPAVINA